MGKRKMWKLFFVYVVETKFLFINITPGEKAPC